MMRASAALSWDGARVPAGRLSAKARTFLGPITVAKKLAALLAKDAPLELRICWVPRLVGGDDVLLPQFTSPDGMRVPFQIRRTVQFGDVLGVVYWRTSTN